MSTFDLRIKIESANWWLSGSTMVVRYIHSRRKARERRVVRTLMLCWRKKLPPLPVKITLIRLMGKGQRNFDVAENLPMGFKHIKDQIAKSYGLKDDEDGQILWYYAQERSPDGRPGSRMVVEEVE